MNKQQTLWNDQRTQLRDSIDLSLASLRAYGQRYAHWVIAYSGGKDSSAVATFVAWAILNKQVPPPESLTVMYADTRQELPPLQATAMHLLEALCADGFSTQVVLPELDSRFYVYMLGRGVPPPKNRFRWCTSMLKVKPMATALETLREAAGQKLLMLTGVRLGESAMRDQRIALSCGKNSGECGQGWFQTQTDSAVADTLAPLVHWRLCHVWDWLYLGEHHYRMVADIAVVYGEDDIRTGCVGCNLASRDTALEYLIKQPDYAYLTPLMELKPLFSELTKAKNRHRKTEPSFRKDGLPVKNVQRLGPLTMEARKMGLARILDIQTRARVDLINEAEEARINELWQMGVFPNGWDGDELTGDAPVASIRSAGTHFNVQDLLV